MKSRLGGPGCVTAAAAPRTRRAHKMAAVAQRQNHKMAAGKGGKKRGPRPPKTPRNYPKNLRNARGARLKLKGFLFRLGVLG